MIKKTIYEAVLTLTLLGGCFDKQPENNRAEKNRNISAELSDGSGQPCDTFTEAECKNAKVCITHFGSELKKLTDVYMGCTAFESAPTECGSSIACFRNDKDSTEVQRPNQCAPEGWTEFECPAQESLPACESLNQLECQAAKSCLPHFGTTLDGKSKVFMTCFPRGVACDEAEGCYRSEKDGIEVKTPNLCTIKDWTNFQCPLN